MGEAKRRGTPDERRNQAIAKRERNMVIAKVYRSVQYRPEFTSLSDQAKYDFLQAEATRILAAKTAYSTVQIPAGAWPQPQERPL